MITRMLLGVTLLFGILLLTLPDTDERSLKKMASASMLMCSKEFRAKVAAQIGRDEPRYPVFDHHCPDTISTLRLDTDGVITASNSRHGLKLIMTPVLEAGMVRWSCRGEPAEFITGLCRGLKPASNLTEKQLDER